MLDDSKTLGEQRRASATAADDDTPFYARANQAGSEGQDGAFNLAGYWRLALKHRILILSIFAAAVFIGLAMTLLATPRYTASTTMQIDREAARVFNTEDNTPRESLVQGEEFFQTQYGLLRSESLSERVMESLGLASSNNFLDAMNVAPPSQEEGGARAFAEKRRALVIRTLQDNLGVSPVRGSRLVELSFNSPDPQLAARVANAFAENFIQSNLDRKIQSSSYAREFLEGRIASTKSKLEDAERQLVVYATQQQIINVNDGEGSSTENNQSLASKNLVALNSALAEARAARVAAEEKWRLASVTPLAALPDVFQNLSVQRLTEERARADAVYQQNLNTYRPEFPAMLQQKALIDELDRQINAISASIKNSIRNEYTVAVNQERSLQGQVNGLKDDVLDLRDRSIQYNILQREVDTSRTLYDGLLQRYKEVGIAGEVTTNNVSIVDEANPPTAPSSPKLLINLLVAAFLGAGLGVLCAFVLEALDESLASPDDVEAKLGIAVLGAVPQLEKDQTPASALADLRSPFSEAYYSLRTALQFSTPDGAPRSLLMTSSRPAEGKSTTAFALAQGFARVGKKVLLVDGDLRNPSMHRLMGVDNDVGLSNLLSGSATLASAARPTPFQNLMFIPCGPLPPNPAELLGSERIRRFLDSALAEYDHVIIDGPPVLGFADAPVLAANVGATLFVLESRGTRRGQAKGALRRLHMGRAHLVGVALTKFNAKATSYGSYDYAYDYQYGASAGGAGNKRR